MGNWTGLPTMLTVLTQKPASIFEQRVARPGLMSMTERPYTLHGNDEIETVITELKGEAARSRLHNVRIGYPGVA
jgi:hypothetical protein